MSDTCFNNDVQLTSYRKISEDYGKNPLFDVKDYTEKKEIRDQHIDNVVKKLPKILKKSFLNAINEKFRYVDGQSAQGSHNNIYYFYRMCEMCPVSLPRSRGATLEDLFTQIMPENDDYKFLDQYLEIRGTKHDIKVLKRSFFYYYNTISMDAKSIFDIPC